MTKRGDGRVQVLSLSSLLIVFISTFTGQYCISCDTKHVQYLAVYISLVC